MCDQFIVRPPWLLEKVLVPGKGKLGYAVNCCVSIQINIAFLWRKYLCFMLYHIKTVCTFRGSRDP